MFISASVYTGYLGYAFNYTLTWVKFEIFHNIFAFELKFQWLHTFGRLFLNDKKKLNSGRMLDCDYVTYAKRCKWRSQTRTQPESMNFKYWTQFELEWKMRNSLNELFSVNRLKFPDYVHFWIGFLFLFANSLDVQYTFVDYLYTPTYTRIGAYFIGVYAGWFLSAKDRKLNIKKVNYVHCTHWSHF